MDLKTLLKYNVVLLNVKFISRNDLLRKVIFSTDIRIELKI